MKHLKSHQIYESLRNIELDVKDMFLDLKDLGHYVDIDMRPQGVDMFSVSVSNDKLFDWSSVKEEFLRSKDYILNNKFTLSKLIISYYQATAFNDSGTKVISRMKTEKFSGSNWSYFLHFVDEISTLGSKIYEITFIYNTK